MPLKFQQLLGPSALGQDEAYLARLFPPKRLGGLKLVADIGLVLYLFIIGMELDPKLLVTHGKVLLPISYLRVSYRLIHVFWIFCREQLQLL